MLQGLNHLTLAVTDVARSLRFYTELLHATPQAQWDGGAYLSLGELWLCLSLDPLRASTQASAKDYTHYAFSIAPEHFDHFVQRARAWGVTEWKSNRSEGESLYFLDPDGHQLEVHAGILASRLAQCRAQPYAGMQFFQEA